MKANRLTKQQAGIVLKAFLFHHANQAPTIGEPKAVLSRVAAGRQNPTPPILKYFDLKQEGDFFVCQSR